MLNRGGKCRSQKFEDSKSLSTGCWGGSMKSPQGSFSACISISRVERQKHCRRQFKIKKDFEMSELIWDEIKTNWLPIGFQNCCHLSGKPTRKLFPSCRLENAGFSHESTRSSRFEFQNHRDKSRPKICFWLLKVVASEHVACFQVTASGTIENWPHFFWNARCFHLQPKKAHSLTNQRNKKRGVLCKE